MSASAGERPDVARAWRGLAMHRARDRNEEQPMTEEAQRPREAPGHAEAKAEIAEKKHTGLVCDALSQLRQRALAPRSGNIYNIHRKSPYTANSVHFLSISTILTSQLMGEMAPQLCAPDSEENHLGRRQSETNEPSTGSESAHTPESDDVLVKSLEESRVPRILLATLYVVVHFLSLVFHLHCALRAQLKRDVRQRRHKQPLAKCFLALSFDSCPRHVPHRAPHAALKVRAHAARDKQPLHASTAADANTNGQQCCSFVGFDGRRSNVVASDSKKARECLVMFPMYPLCAPTSC